MQVHLVEAVGRVKYGRIGEKKNYKLYLCITHLISIDREVNLLDNMWLQGADKKRFVDCDVIWVSGTIADEIFLYILPLCTGVLQLNSLS